MRLQGYPHEVAAYRPRFLPGGWATDGRRLAHIEQVHVDGCLGLKLFDAGGAAQGERGHCNPAGWRPIGVPPFAAAPPQIEAGSSAPGAPEDDFDD